MKKRLALIAVLSYLAAIFLTVPVYAEGKIVTIYGKQTAGSGHAINAKTESERVELKTEGKVIKVEGDAPSFCIWAAVTPQNRTARSVLCGSKTNSIVGKTLPAGIYTVLPGLNGKSSAYVSIQVQEQ